MVNFSFPEGHAGKASVLGIGVFDGVHLGHRRIMSELLEMGRRFEAVPVAVTFFPHPRAILCPASPPRLLLPPEERLRRLHLAGAEKVSVIEFTAEAAAASPEEFIDELLAAHGNVRGICVGEHWRFGKDGAGDMTFLADALARRDIAFAAVPELKIGDEIVSSSGIRKAVAAGRIAEAAKMLDTLPALYGTVERGLGIAGTQLDAPTANLRVEFGVLPPDGVYAGWTAVDGRKFATVTNIGFAPTFASPAPARRVECHLIGFSGDLYGRKLAVEIAAKLRNEQRFATVDELKRQIRQDQETSMKLLSGRNSE